MYQQQIKILCLVVTFVIATIANATLYADDLIKPGKKKEKMKIAVFDFNTNGVPPEYAKIVRNYIETSLYSTRDFRMLERENIEKILREKKLVIPKSEDTSNVVLTGKSLSTDFIIVGSVDKLEQYKITIRVVDIEKGEILSVYDRIYDSANEIDAITKNISKRISNDITTYVRKGYLSSHFFDFYDVMLTAQFNYTLPFGELGDIVNPGLGASIEAGVNNIFFENISLGLEIGYTNFSGNKNSNDRAGFMPVLINTGYRIYLFKRLYLLTSLSAGLNIINMNHGTGHGFNMDNDTSGTFVDSICKAGINICFAPLNSIHFLTGAKYCIDFEKNQSYHFIEIGLGAIFIF